MKQTVKPGPTPENWNAEALFLKAQRYAERMATSDGDGWEQPFWSSLALELLARAALSNVSPALLVENDKDWSHLDHALGFDLWRGKRQNRSPSRKYSSGWLESIRKHLSRRTIASAWCTQGDATANFIRAKRCSMELPVLPGNRNFMPNARLSWPRWA